MLQQLHALLDLLISSCVVTASLLMVSITPPALVVQCCPILSLQSVAAHFDPRLSLSVDQLSCLSFTLYHISGGSRKQPRGRPSSGLEICPTQCSTQRKQRFKYKFEKKSQNWLKSQHLRLSRFVNPLERRGNYNATSNNMKMAHWTRMGGLLYLVQIGGDWAGLQPAQVPPRCTKCNSPRINGQCTNQRIAVSLLKTYSCGPKGS